MKTSNSNAHENKKIVWALAGIGMACVIALPVFGQWYIEVGPVYRGDMDISVQGGSRAADSGASGARSGTVGRSPTGRSNLLNDDGTAQILREFDNGYVGPSGWEWARTEGLTQYFGYETPGQYNAATDTLNYDLTLNNSVSQRRTTTRVSTDSVGWNDSTDTEGVGIMATAGYMFGTNDTFSLGAQMRFGWLDGMDGGFHNRPAFEQSIERTTYEETLRQEQTYQYSYDTLGNPVFPDAPYVMTDPAGVGPLIADRPESIALIDENNQSTTRQVGRSTEHVVSSVDLDVDAHLLTFQLGPRMEWQTAPKLALLIQPAITANMLDSSVRRQETFRRGNGDTIASWNDRSNDQDWRLGAGLEVGAKLSMTEDWYILLSGGYEWVDDYDLSVGPDNIEMDVSGYQAEIAVGVAL